MNLIQFLTLWGLFLVGAFFGGFLIHWIPVLPHGLAEVLCGAASVLIFAWPIYKSLGWLPQAPPCPRCGESEYALVSRETGGAQWRCKKCGQLILLKAESVLVIDEKGEVVPKLKLRWPKFVGRWKAV